MFSFNIPILHVISNNYTILPSLHSPCNNYYYRCTGVNTDTVFKLIQKYNVSLKELYLSGTRKQNTKYFHRFFTQVADAHRIYALDLSREFYQIICSLQLWFYCRIVITAINNTILLQIPSPGNFLTPIQLPSIGGPPTPIICHRNQIVCGRGVHDLNEMPPTTETKPCWDRDGWTVLL